MRLSDLLASQPPPRVITGARAAIRKQLQDSRRRLVVIDDDPTGTQTVHDVKVYMDWSAQRLQQALGAGAEVFYVSTNSRSLSAQQATDLAQELGANLAQAATATGAEVIVASRGDSTLRGHFPAEVEALAHGMGQPPDGVLICPAFFEAHRFTVNDVHWVDQAGGLVSAELSESARDPVFGYRHGNLKQWVQEKTQGRVSAETVRSISLAAIRQGGPEAVAEQLMQAANGEPIIINAACYDDLEVVVLGLLAAEAKDKRFIYRCAASFVKARGGFPDRPLLVRDDLMPGDGPGLVVVGSYVERTSRQLQRLLESGLVTGIELDASQLPDAGSQEREIERAADRANDAMSKGRSACVYTSCDKHTAQGERFLEAGRTIMSSLCRVVGRISVAPGFVVAKGGITSIEIARSGFGVTEATVLGQILEGVPVWRLDAQSRVSGIPYVVFPGNVGDDSALHNVVKCLSPAAADGARGS